MADLFGGRAPLILDGGMATRLEEYGCDLSDALWSARMLRDDPELVRRVHVDYFDAGADVAVSASYQASVDGFARFGIVRAEAERLILASVRLASEAREEAGGGTVAAGVGPYGAARADGSEYTGDYGLGEDDLYAWHHDRWHLLASAGADLLACETIPSAAEARALARLMRESPGTPVWLSFSARDGEHIADGTPIAEAAAAVAGLPQVVGVGVNCTAPRYVPSLVAAATAATGLPGVAYPNSGRTWDAAARTWTGSDDPADFARAASLWPESGARFIGGCCQTGTEHIRRLRAALD
ncbi:homocysteine S-methyltransferase [Nocardiopsis coralliicola]